MAWAFYVRSTLQNAVREGVRYAITSQTITGMGQDASIKTVVQQNATGLLSGGPGLALINIQYYLPNTLAPVSGLNSNQGGNIVEVYVQGYSLPPLGPILRNPAPLSRGPRRTTAWKARREASPPRVKGPGRHVCTQPNPAARQHRDRVLLSCVLWTTILMGLSTVGLNLIRALQVEQIRRDAAVYQAALAWISPHSNQSLLMLLAAGRTITATGGNGVSIFSTVEYIDTPQCAQAVGGPSCPNLGQNVFIQRVVVGNPGLFSSPFGTPNSGMIGTSGNIPSSSYLTNTSARASGFGSLISLTGGQVAYLTEVYLSSARFAWGTI